MIEKKQKRKNSLNKSCLLLGAILFVSATFHCTRDIERPLVEVFHAPETFSRRSGDLTANIAGSVSTDAANARYRINNSQWFNIRQDGYRVPPPLFTIELFSDQLSRGSNNLDIEVSAKNGDADTTVSIQFQYDPKPISLPKVVDWETTQLDVYDGRWEKILHEDGSWRVRPKPGFEDYDRILIVSGGFAEARRIETDVIFRYRVGRKPYGFGLIPLWGGSPDDRNVTPRRGWRFGVGWYYSLKSGIGISYSYKYGNNIPTSLSSYFEFEPKKDTRYHLVMEAWPQENSESGMSRYQQRMKWWSEEEACPTEWIQLTDQEGILSQHGEYAVALLAHRCQVEFGPVRITSLTPEYVMTERRALN